MTDERSTNETIVIVDDDEFAREVIESLFRRALPRARILTAPNGEAGLALYREEAPDIVITDLRMLGMSGADLIEAIRAVDSDTPIFAITGAPDIRVVPGATEVILKTDFQRLIERVSALLRPSDLEPQSG